MVSYILITGYSILLFMNPLYFKFLQVPTFYKNKKNVWKIKKTLKNVKTFFLHLCHQLNPAVAATGAARTPAPASGVWNTGWKLTWARTVYEQATVTLRRCEPLIPSELDATHTYQPLSSCETEWNHSDPLPSTARPRGEICYIRSVAEHSGVFTDIVLLDCFDTALCDICIVPLKWLFICDTVKLTTWHYITL